MSQKNNLIDYITRAIKAGSSESQIKRNLQEVGWENDQITKAYKQALINNGVPSPDENLTPELLNDESTIISASNNRKSTAGEIVVNLLSFILLAIVATSTGTLFYQIINKFFPDTLKINSSYGGLFSTSAIHYATAVLIVAFPVYYIVMYFWFRSFRKDKDKKETGLTKFLTYLVLFITAVTILGNLIATVYTFLQGELTVRFFLKALVIFIITGLIFGFYYLERRKIQYKKSIGRNYFKFFGSIASALVVGGIIFGFFATGSPALERKRGFDNQRENDLSEIAQCIKNYSQEYKRLPSSLQDLEKSTTYSYCAKKEDPETSVAYEYSIIRQIDITNKEGEFELCATFDLDSKESIDSNKNRYYNKTSQWSNHTAGHDCHRATVVVNKLQR